MAEDPMSPPYGIESFILRSGDSFCLRLEWKNSRVRRDNFLFAFYLLFWLVFSAAAIWTTYSILFLTFEGGGRWFDWLCTGTWLIFVWAIAIGLPFTLLGLTRSEWLELSKTTISFGEKGFLASKPVTIALEDVREVFLGHFGDVGDCESFLTFNIHSSRGRHLCGAWLDPRLKVQLFEFIEGFVSQHAIPLHMKLGAEELRSIA